MDTAITIASVPAILAVVNLLKGFGFSGSVSALFAVFFGIVFSLMASFSETEPIVAMISSGVLLGLAAAGLFDATKTNVVTNNIIHNTSEPRRAAE